MRFQCRIGDGVAPPPRPATHRVTIVPAAPHVQPASNPPARRGAPEFGWAQRGAVAAAVIVAVAGCATRTTTTASRGAPPAKSYKIAPVYDVQHAGSNAESYFALGQYHEETLAWEKAIDAYRKAVALDAQHVESWNALGVALAHAGRYAEAEAALRRAIAFAPARPHLRNNLGYVLLLAGKPADAVVVLQPAADQEGASGTAKANLKEALARAAAASGGSPRIVQGVTTTAPTVTAVAPIAAPALVTAAPVEAAVAVPAMRVGYAPDVPALQTVEAGTRATATPAAALPASISGSIAPLPTPTVATPKPLPPARLEVSNGNGATGMAGQVGRWLDRQGMPVARVSNQQPFVQRQTVVQYRSGHEEAALRVARALPAAARAESAATPGLRSDVRVLLGRDWMQTASCLGRNTCQSGGTAVASSGELAAPGRRP